MILKLREDADASLMEKRNSQWITFEGEDEAALKERMKSKGVDPDNYIEVTSDKQKTDDDVDEMPKM